MKQITKSAFLITLLLNSIFTIAQGNDTLEIKKNEKGKVIFARFQANASSNRKMKNDTIFLKSILQAKKEDSFRKIKEDLDELGITHKKFQHYYKGLKVENSEFLIHGKNGNIEVINGDFNDINISIINPSLNEKQALAKALAYVNSKKYKWEDIAMEKFVKQNTNNPNATYYPKGELVISKDYLSRSNSWKLSWKFTISSMEPNYEQLIYVDANDGSIINNIPLVFDANISCTSQTRYSGTQNTMGDSFTGGTRLQESRNGVNIQTLNLNSTYNYGNAVDFINSSTSWTASSWTNFNADQSALDAHWGAEKVFDFWKTVFDRNSINGSGIRVLSYVHAGSNWANAQWVGGSNSNYMQYGDGAGTINPLVALDICAHEFGHGITQFTANLTSGTQESGALNEGFSDIWGACVEHWAAPNKETWLMGEELFPFGIYSGIRDIQNPKSTLTMEGQHPDVYHGNFWSSTGEPHCNSTVLSHWFYLLSQGSNGVQTNELGNSYSIGGISIENAQKIAYRAESFYLNSSADYSAARNATIQAAIDLASTIPNAISEVTNAWYAVGVGNQYQYTISGSSALCSQGIYSISNLPPGATVSWSVMPSNIVTLQQNGSSVTLTKIGVGKVTLSALINGYLTITKVIPVGAPYSLAISSYSNLDVSNYADGSVNVLRSGGSYAYEGVLSLIDDIGLATTYQWSVSTSYPSGKPVYWWANGGTVDVATKFSDTHITLKCTASNSCGSYSRYVYFYNGTMPMLVVLPNPASDEVSVSIEDFQTANASMTNSTTNVTPLYTVTVVDSYGYTVYSETKKEKKFNIQTSSYKNGVYVVVVSDGTKMCQNKLIIQH